jgi:hypothetical protein
MTSWRTTRPAFSWSFTRDRMLRSCPRRYYYHYHLAPTGARQDAAARARKAYMLKHLTSLDLVLGLAVHRAAHVLARAIRAGRPQPPTHSLWTGVRDALNSACAASRRPALFLQLPERHTMLRELYYGGGLEQGTVERIRQKAVACLENLGEATIWDTVRGLRPGGLQIMDTPLRFRVGTMQAWAAPDLVYRPAGGDRVVLDWKTGRKNPSAEAEQVSVYGLFLRTTLPTTRPADLRATIVYLRSGEEEEYRLTDDRLAAAEARIREGTEAMRRCQRLADQLGPDAIAHFPLTDRRALCPRCNFFELCADELREPIPGCVPPPQVPVEPGPLRPAGRPLPQS